jgi:hypothetical protein
MDLGFGALLSWLAGLAQLIYCALIRWACWLLDFLFQMAFALMKTIIPVLPHTAQESLDAMMFYWGTIDGWVPLTEVSVIMSFYFSISVSLMTWRILRRQSPF